MREIKYRVWDTREAHWEEPGFFAIIGSGFGLRENDYGRWVRTIPDDRWIFMQFTGLKDKNGKEIYERDILEFYAKRGERISEVTFDSGVFGTSTEPLYMLDLALCEVIGSIYENPELITK
jgi:uncharacterized phage protein (TIGR01671 family)